MHPSLSTTHHRPWPLPLQPWTWRQSWLDLAFMHYPVARENLESLLPTGVVLDTVQNTAWVGVVPFLMAGVMKRPFPDLPFFSSFPELNLRTYVTVGDKPGVWFFSLDAASRLIVFGGRTFYNLPYHYAPCRFSRTDTWYTFKSSRRKGNVQFEAAFRPVGDPFFAQPGSFEHWATERYCLYSLSRRGAIQRVEVHHAPWPLQPAEVRVVQNDLFQPAGITPLEDTPRCHFSTGVDVVSFGVQHCP